VLETPPARVNVRKVGIDIKRSDNNLAEISLLLYDIIAIVHVDWAAYNSGCDVVICGW